jgi:glycosyltransferase involved in cell wall biosynthesis
MRIAIFSDLYLPSLGGTETAVFNQKKALEAAGHTVLLFAPRHFKPAEADDEYIFRLPRLPFVRVVGQPIFMPFPWHKRKIRNILKQHNVQAVHMQTEFGVANIGMKVARQLKLPVVYTAHTLLWRQLDPKSFNQQMFGAMFMAMMWLYWRRGPEHVPREEDETWGTWLLRRLTITMAELVDHVVAPSEHFRDKLHTWGCKTPITPVANMLSAELPEIKPLPQTPNFIWIGRVTREKRPLEFVKAVRLALQISEKPFTVDMYGGGPLLDVAKNAAAEVKQLRVHGPAQPSLVPDIMNNASALVLTSYRFDNQPMVIAEAVTHGRGVLYCDDELLEGLIGGAGKLVGHTPEEIASGLCQLAEKPVLLEQMSEAAVKNRDLFTPARYIQNIEKVYQEVIK